MATVINNPAERADNSSGTGVLIGILLAVLIVLLVLAFGMPYLRQRGMGSVAPSTNSSQTAPATNGVSGSGSFNLQAPAGGTQSSGGASGAASGGTSGY